MRIELRGVAFEYTPGIRVLDGIDLTVDDAQSVALIGANGSGKTTLVRHLVGLLRPTAGSVLLDGSDTRDRMVAQLAACVGLAFQDPDRQIFGRTVRSEVEFGPLHLGRSADVSRAAADTALDKVGLADAVDAHPGDLGQARRKLLSIASVLAMETPIVVLDEPTAALDANGIERVQGLVGRLRAKGISVILISHDMRFIATSAQRIVRISDGRVRREASTVDVFDNAGSADLRDE